MDLGAFQAFPEERFPRNPVANDEEAIDKCVEVLTYAIQDATAVSAPKRRHSADPRPPLPASIEDEIRLKNRLMRQWQITKAPALKAQVNRLQRSAERMAEGRVERYAGILRQ
jgi:hypothetical protein